MKSPTITAGRQTKSSASWIHGVNSVRNPWTLPEDQFKWGVNVNCRGGLVQTRNGFKMKLSLPKGNFQGGIIFNSNKQYQSAKNTTNLSGVKISQQAAIYDPSGNPVVASDLPYAVFCVDGKVYYCPFPLTQPKSWDPYLLENIKLDPNVDRVNFIIATQVASTNDNANTTVVPSHRIVIIQDGINNAGYWDGSDTTGQISTSMPIGYWMAYSGNRLWVATGNIIAASDLGNPLNWAERTEGAGRGDFSVPRPVTGMHDYVGQNNDTRLYIFTDQSTYSLASGILDRAQWAQTPNFQSTLYPTIGCVAGNSIAFQAGMMWWYSQGGLVSVDVAASSYLSSQVLYKDLEMAKAKRLMSSDLSGICSISFENYLLYSIPYLEPTNSVTMVLDYASASEWNQSKSPAWNGVWTGIRPVIWSSNVINSQPRCFAFSVDYGNTSDGSFNHLWEVFMPERYDTYLEINQDGSTDDRVQRIYCQMETGLIGDAMDYKQLVYSEIDCSQIAGTVDVNVSYRGTRGTYLPILNSRLLATTEPYQYNTSQYADEISKLGILQTQSRRLITENVTRIPKSSCESTYTTDVDKAFSLLIEWCGSMGVESLRVFLDPWSTASVGNPSSNETKNCVVGEDGTSISVSLNPSPQEKIGNSVNSWSSTQTRTVTYRGCSPAVSVTATASYISYTSLADAQNEAGALATQNAQNAVNQYKIAHNC
jgi:hypothetical protein